jgi:flagellar basal-body rod modification protein FlgD
MTDAISATGTSATTGTGISGTSTTLSTGLDKDAFLQLLVAQLKYQDPTKPVDSSEFLAQTAQFTLVEKFDQLAEADKALLASTQTQTATAMVGKAITWADATGTHSGTVTSVTIANGTPKLRVGQVDVPMDTVTSVSVPDGSTTTP